MQEIFGQAAAIVHFIAFAPYILSIIRRKTRPHRGSWFVWTLLGFLLLVSYSAVGADETIWMPITLFLGPLVILLLSLRYGVGGWDDAHDKYCMVGACIGLTSLLIFNTPFIALYVGILTDLFAAIPTVRKSIIDPESEDALAWSLALIASILNLFAIDDWSFHLSSYPVYAAIVFALITLPLVHHRWSKNIHT
jgi:hypothetical protein